MRKRVTVQRDLGKVQFIKVCFKEEAGQAPKDYHPAETKGRFKVHPKGGAGYSKQVCNLVEVGRSVLYLGHDRRLQGWYM